LCRKGSNYDQKTGEFLTGETIKDDPERPSVRETEL
jgi:hypothetical protein